MKTVIESPARRQSTGGKFILVESGIYRNPGSGTYFERPVLSGRRTWRSLGTKNLKLAREELHRRRAGVIRNLCGNPESVIVTLDADDSLLGCSVLERVAVEYNNGADVTVGSMLRTDKHKIYVPNLDHPRSNRGGNVWQHLRTFKKHLFDQISDDELQINGSFLNKATDWAIMLPIVEMARKPVYIPTPLYLHEPSDTSSERRYLQRLPIAMPES